MACAACKGEARVVGGTHKKGKKKRKKEEEKLHNAWTLQIPWLTAPAHPPKSLKATSAHPSSRRKGVPGSASIRGTLGTWWWWAPQVVGVDSQQASQQPPCALKTASAPSAVQSLRMCRAPQRLCTVQLIVDSGSCTHAAFVQHSNWRFICHRAVLVSAENYKGEKCRVGEERPGLIQEVIKNHKPSPTFVKFTDTTELLGIYEALSAFLRACRSAGLEDQLREVCRVVVFNDNRGAVAQATRAMEQAPSAASSPVHTALASLRDTYRVHTEFRRLPRTSKKLGLADAMGRWHEEEWNVAADALASAVERAMQDLSADAARVAAWPPDVHLLASERTHLRECGAYYSIKWDRQCAAGIAWDLDWGKWPEVALHGQLQVFGVSPSQTCAAVDDREGRAARNGGQNWGRKPVCYIFPQHQDTCLAMRKIELNLATVWLVLRRDLSSSEALFLKKLPVAVSVPLPRAAKGRPVVESPQQNSQAWTSPLVLHFITWESGAA